MPRATAANVTRVEHPCYKCQAAVEEGIPFCPHCGAPQIRVSPPEGDTSNASPPPTLPDAPKPTPNYVIPGSVWTQGQPTYVAQSSPVRWDIAWRGALLAGIGAAVLSGLPIVSLGCCLWLLGAGAIAVYLYQRRVPGTFITSGMGMRIGALTGVFSFVLNAIGATAMFAFSGPEVRRLMQEQMERQMAKAPDPKAAEIMQQFLAKLSTPEGIATFFVVVMAVVAVVFVLFCAAGGALGAALLGQRRTR